MVTRTTVKRPVVLVDVKHAPYVTVTELALAVVELNELLSPLNAAVRLTDPMAVGVHVQLASPPITLVVAHPVIVVPLAMKFTVPVVPDAAPVTVARMMLVVAVFGNAGTDDNVMDEVPQVVWVATVSGLFVAPESTGVTRVLYSVPASSPVMVDDVDAVLAVNVVHVESDDFLYSTL